MQRENELWNGPRRSGAGARLRLLDGSLTTWHWCGVLLAVIAGILLSHPALTAQAASKRRTGPIRPEPASAGADVPAPLHEGCMVAITGTESGSCLYGDPHGRRTLILFGDSHALQHFPGVQVVAKRDHLRLLVLTKRECTPALVTTYNSRAYGPYTECDAWRQAELKRIEAGERRAAVVLGTYTDYKAYGPSGALSGAANAAAMEAGYVHTLRRLRHAGLGVAVIRDTPEAPDPVPSCVLAHIRDPAACDFPKPHRWDREFDLRAARRARVPLINLNPLICPRGLCRAVIDRILVYRDHAHLTATFSRTTNRVLEPGLGLALLNGSRRGSRALDQRAAAV